MHFNYYVQHTYILMNLKMLVIINWTPRNKTRQARQTNTQAATQQGVVGKKKYINNIIPC